MAGTFYRLGERSASLQASTGPDTWLRPFETRGSSLYKKPDLCEAHGLSVYQSWEEVSRARDIVPWMARKSVAAVTVTEDDGVMRHTPTPEGDSHHDWWTNPLGLIPAAIVVEAHREGF